jgi:two-component system chemotaxis response regulator CheB
MSIRVMVVDSSPAARRMMVQALGREPEIEVVGCVSSGARAIELLAQLEPDLVTLDLETAGGGGLDTIEQLRRRRPKLPIVMVSAATQRSALATLEALGRGASDYVSRPEAQTSEGSSTFAQQLCLRVLALGRQRLPVPAPARSPGNSGYKLLGRPRLVALAASTGGPDALTTLMRSLPHPLPVPMALVQHMPPVFTKLFAERLAGVCRATVQEARDGMVLGPGTVLVAPGGQHLAVRAAGQQLIARLDSGPPENSVRPAADVLFRSAAEACQGSVLLVVLTGLGEDGCAGARLAVAAGAVVIAQDEASSVVWGMPGAVVRAGLASRVLPLERIADAILWQIGGRSS